MHKTDSAANTTGTGSGGSSPSGKPPAMIRGCREKRIEPYTAVLDAIKETQTYWCRLDYTPDGGVSRMIFGFYDAIKWVRRYPEIIAFKFVSRLPEWKRVLEVVGVEANGDPFPIAYAFVTDGDCKWALQYLKEQYMKWGAELPSVVVTDEYDLGDVVSDEFPSAHHIYNRKTKIDEMTKSMEKVFRKNHIAYHYVYQLFNSRSEYEYWAQVSNLRREFGEIRARYLSYDINFDDKTRDKFVDVGTDKFRNFGHTSVAFPDYQFLINTPLLEAFREIDYEVLHLYEELLWPREGDPLSDYPESFFDEVRSKISLMALELLNIQREIFIGWEELGQIEPPCTGIFYTKTGIPCAHRLRNIEGPIMPADVDPHWLLIDDSVQREFLEDAQFRVEGIVVKPSNPGGPEPNGTDQAAGTKVTPVAAAPSSAGDREEASVETQESQRPTTQPPDIVSIQQGQRVRSPPVEKPRRKQARIDTSASNSPSSSKAGTGKVANSSTEVANASSTTPESQFAGSVAGEPIVSKLSRTTSSAQVSSAPVAPTSLSNDQASGPTQLAPESSEASRPLECIPTPTAIRINGKHIPSGSSVELIYPHDSVTFTLPPSQGGPVTHSSTCHQP
ncbi:hypothetical protein DICA4_D14290 [Diutina catenulata]